MSEVWLQELLILWHKFFAEWHESTAPRLDETLKLAQPTLPEFMSWLVAYIAPTKSGSKAAPSEGESNG